MLFGQLRAPVARMSPVTNKVYERRKQVPHLRQCFRKSATATRCYSTALRIGNMGYRQMAGQTSSFKRDICCVTRKGLMRHEFTEVMPVIVHFLIQLRKAT
jgi:hypothetical protein